ncbi:MAG: hypothetical protein ACYSW3_27995 [Planctomycetota bacterium]|jgi:hypothetical protein
MYLIRKNVKGYLAGRRNYNLLMYRTIGKNGDRFAGKMTEAGKDVVDLLDGSARSICRKVF